MTRSLAVALLLVALVGVACGPAPSAAPSTPGALSTPASAAPSTPAPATPSTAASAAPSAAADRHADPALESLLPETLGGVNLTRESQAGSDLTGKSDALDKMLADLGKTIDEFTIASAYSAAGDVKAQVGVWRIDGAATDRLVPAFQATVQASSQTKLSVSEVQVGGHAVTQIGATGELAQGPLYVYAKDDMLLFVQTPDPALAEEAMSSLP